MATKTLRSAQALHDAYVACARVTRREARNFYFAFASLPQAQRRAVYALYAFCREADDCVDDAAAEEALFAAEDTTSLQGGSVDPAPLGAREGIARLRERLIAASEGRPMTAVDLALADAISRYGVEVNDLDDVLTGVAMDLHRSRYATFDELRDYCYHVASAVGLATLPILTNGVAPTGVMREFAIDLGLGMQLVNILRDVAEDLARDRIYLPQEELGRFGVDPAALARGQMTEPLRLHLAFQATRAMEFLERGRRLLPALPRRGRACPWLLAEIYGRILKRIVAADYDVFAGRISLPAREKLLLLATARWRV